MGTVHPSLKRAKVIRDAGIVKDIPGNTLHPPPLPILITRQLPSNERIWEMRVESIILERGCVHVEGVYFEEDGF